MQKPNSHPYQFITRYFSLDDLFTLCFELGVNYENLRGNTLSSKALALQEYMGRHRQLGELLAAIGRSEKRDFFHPEEYLYLLIEDYLSAAQIVTLCNELKLPCEKLGLSRNDLLPYDHNQRYRREKSQILHGYMAEQNQLGALVQALSQLSPDINLEAYDQWLELDSTGATQNLESSSPQEPLLQPGITYENFDLRIGEGRDGIYPVEVLYSPQGQVLPIWQTFPVDDPEFLALAYFLKSLVAAGKDARELGLKMRHMLFPPPIWAKFQECLAVTKQNGHGLRIRLRIDPPELDQWPWEYCYDVQFDFLAHNPKTPIVRYHAEPLRAELLATPYPLRILAIMASPHELEQVDIEAEATILQEALNPLKENGKVEIDIIQHVTARDLRTALQRKPYHILHYFGHGIFRSGGEGALALETESRELQELDGNQMRALLRDSPIRVVVLNACELASHEGQDPMSSVARSLIRAGVPAVIAMQFKLPQSTALLFSRNLYQSLAFGKPLDQAVTEIRRAAYIDLNDQIYWGIPVLLMRAENGIIWQND